MTIKQVQHLLAYFGGKYDPGPVDGIDGPKTQNAVRNFQKAFGGLGVTGVADEATQKALAHAVAYGISESAETENSIDWNGIQHFKRSEFACKCGKYCDGFPAEPDLAMVRAADAIRARLGRPITVNSGLRCQRHNAAVGGASASQHMYGTAADLGKPAGVTPEQMAAVAEEVLDGGGGIGIYSWGIHIDTRKEKARWKG